MRERKPLSKKLRFEIFKRDGYKCVYCGNTPPNVILEADHIIPVNDGGKNIIENLVTACFDCNRGKGKHTLNSVPASVLQNAEIEKERLEQYEKYIAFYKKKVQSDESLVNLVESVYSASFDEYVFTDKFRNSVSKFIKELGIETVHEAMKYACSKIYHNQQVLTYFCGICWNKIREKE